MSCVGNLQNIVFLNERYWGQTLTLAKKLRGRYLMLYFHTKKWQELQMQKLFKCNFH